MKRILWCGGSHLGNAKGSAIERLHRGLLNGYQSDFYITAAPANRNWSHAGGRYRIEGRTVEGNRAMPNERRNLDDYDAIIFVGQWIQPWFAFRDGMPLSAAVLERSLNRLPLHPSITRGGTTLQWFNEPLELFPRLAPGRVVLIRDPEAPLESYQRVPPALKRAFGRHLACFCRQAGIHLCPQFEGVLDRRLTTRRRYLRDPTGHDLVHMGDAYWHMLFERLLSPLLCRVLPLRSHAMATPRA